MPVLAERLAATRPIVRLLTPWTRTQLRQKFFVFSQSRCGSTLLVDLLNSHPEVDCREEIFRQAPYFPTMLLRAIEGSSRAPVFGFKMHVHQLDLKLRLRDPRAFVHALHRRGYRILYLRRRNTVRHVISDQIRRATGVTHVRGDAASAAATDVPRPIRANVPDVLAHLAARERYWSMADEILAGLPHHVIEYERDLSDATRHGSVMDETFRFLELSSAPVSTRLRRINRQDLPSLLENFDELELALRGTVWHDQLEMA